MTGYEEFQQIMIDIERKKKISKEKWNLPPGFEKLFNEFKI